MGFAKQLGISILLMTIYGVAAAQSHISYAPSYESSLLPGSRLVAGGKDEFFITGTDGVEQSAPVIAKVTAPPVTSIVKPAISKKAPVVAVLKLTFPRDDIADKRINRLFALHRSIIAAKQVSSHQHYASLVHSRRIRI